MWISIKRKLHFLLQKDVSHLIFFHLCKGSFLIWRSHHCSFHKLKNFQETPYMTIYNQKHFLLMNVEQVTSDLLKEFLWELFCHVEIIPNAFFSRSLLRGTAAFHTCCKKVPYCKYIQYRSSYHTLYMRI
jgi:hypothetical protein